MPYIIEFERYGKDSSGNRAKAIIVRLLDPSADDTENKIIAEELYPGGLPEGLSLKADVPFAALRLRVPEFQKP